MPLYLRHLPLNVMVGERYLALSGNYVVGAITQQTSGGASNGRWRWGAGFHVEEFYNCGTVDDPAEAKPLIASSFRRGLALADLGERVDARPDDRLPTQLVVRPTPPHDVERDWTKRRAIDWPRRAIIYSGTLMVGILREMPNVEDVGWWQYSVQHHLPWPTEEFQWQGLVSSIEAGFDAIAARWAACLYYGGLEQHTPLQQGRLIRSLT